MSNSGTTSSDLVSSDTSKRTKFETNDIEEAKMPDPTRRSQWLPLAAETSSEMFTSPDNTTLANRLADVNVELHDVVEKRVVEIIGTCDENRTETRG